MSTALGDLLGQVSVETFLRDHFPERHLTVHGSLDRLPSFFSSELLHNPRELSRVYRGPIYVTHRNLGRYQVHGPEPRAFFEELGLSVGFTEVEDLLPGAKEWLRELEADLGMPRGRATLAAFVNGPASGLSAHCDVNEQIAIHIRGPKSFRVLPHSARFPRMQHVPGQVTPPEWLGQAPQGLLGETRLPAEAEQIDLRPGSILFTPRGLYHETLSGDALAVTVVVAFRNPTPAELLTSYLEKVLLQSEEWRQPLDFGWSRDPAKHEGARQRMAALLQKLAGRVGHLEIDRMFACAEAPSTDAKSMQPTMRFQRDPSTHVAVREEGGKVAVEIGLALGTGQRTTLRLPAPLAPALHMLASEARPFTFGALSAKFPEWDSSALASVVASLVRTKLLVELPFEPYESDEG